MRLFSVATVAEGDGRWTIGYEVASVCGVKVTAADPCVPASPAEVGATVDESGEFAVTPIGVVGKVTRPLRCFDSDVDAARDRVLGASEYAAEAALWTGYGIADVVNLTDDATSVTAGADATASIAALIAAQNAKLPGITDAVLHMGVEFALTLGSGQLETLRGIGYGIVVSPAYPSFSAAVTGPVKVLAGSVESGNHYDVSVNRGVTIATRIIAVEFDPCAAFVLG